MGDRGSGPPENCKIKGLLEPMKISQSYRAISHCWVIIGMPVKCHVENRVKEIKEQHKISFHYISTKDNPEDIASRIAVISDLLNNKLWWNGPDWLVQPMNNWPVWEFDPKTKLSCRFQNLNIGREVLFMKQSSLLGRFLLETKVNESNLTRHLE